MLLPFLFRPSRGHRSPATRPSLLLLPLLLLLLLLLLSAGCSGRKQPAAGPANVVVVVMDALRADHLGCYGYARPTSARVDAFAREADLYTTALASSPWTLPSHASMFTGLLPFQHGAHTFETETPGNNVNPLPADRLTLAEALAASGWRTGGFVANDVFLGKRWGVDQGFATWHVENVPGLELNRRILAWLDAPAAGEGDKPFFLFVNYMDTHSPYNTEPRPELDLPWTAERDPQLLVRLYDAVMPGQGPLPRDLIRQVEDQYDQGVVNADLAFGRLLDALRDRGLLDRTLVVLTSDHGEYFGRHHLVEHSKDVYQGALRVPLLVRRPGQRRGRVVEQPASSVDLPGLVLAACGPEVAARWGEAFPLRVGNHPLVSQNFFTRQRDLFDPRWGHRFRRVRTVLFTWPMKYILSSDGANELYDLAADPLEQDNLVKERPEVAAASERQLREILGDKGQQTRPVAQPPLTEQEMRRLRALGYVR